MIRARFAAASLGKNYIFLDEAYDAIFPERTNFWRSPSMCAEDLMNRDNFNVEILGDSLALKVLFSILCEVDFPDSEREAACKKLAMQKLYRVIDPDGTVVRGMETTSRVMRMLADKKTISDIRTNLLT